jgi:two-component system response regulator RegX3
MTTILLIDDDPMITEPLARALRDYNFTVTVADNGRTGLYMALRDEPDAVVLDVLMPQMDGWQVCRALREQSGVPILMLTALGEEVDRILGLELGADDYLTKPFSTRELIVRIKALLRRVDLDRAANQETVFSGGAITLNVEKREVRKGGEPLILRHKEFELLHLLMSRSGQVVTRADIFDLVWGTDWLGDTRTLDVHIRWLRAKIEQDPSQPRLIQTVRGVGYQFIPS